MKNFPATRPLAKRRVRDSERREFPRYALGAPAEVRDPAAKTRAAGQVTMISKKGCFLKATKQFQPSSVLQLHIQKGDTAFETWAKVVPNSPHPEDGMALLFMGTAPEQEQLLHQWIDELAAGASPNIIPC
jgi:PilZ domain